MKALKGNITLLINPDITRIELSDEKSGVMFCEVHLKPEQLVAALARRGYTKCFIQLQHLDKVGKEHEHKTLEFEIPEGLSYGDSEELTKIAQAILDKENEGFTSDGYFNSQNSFFEKDGKRYARTVCRRYV